MDNLFLIRNLLDICELYNIDFRIVLLDQEKAGRITFFFYLH